MGIHGKKKEYSESEKKNLQHNSTACQKRLAKLIEQGERAADLLDAPPESRPAMVGSDRLRAQLDKRFARILRRIEKEKGYLQKIVDRQKEIKEAETDV